MLMSRCQCLEMRKEDNEMSQKIRNVLLLLMNLVLLLTFTKGKTFTPVKYYVNTAANRKNILK